jgi:hypothetical protein
MGIIIHPMNEHSFFTKDNIQQKIYLTVTILFIAFGLFFIRYILPDRFVDSYLVAADGWHMSEVLVEGTWFPLYFRSLLTLWIHKLIYIALYPFNVSGWYAMAFSSSLAGGIAIYALWRIKSHWLFLTINILSGSFLVFVGHVENYAWVSAFLILSFWKIQQWIDGESRLWPGMSFYMLACASHLLALFYAPAFIYVILKHKRYNPYEIIVPIVSLTYTYVLITAIIILLPYFSITSSPESSASLRIEGTELGLERLVPIGSKWAKNHHFTLASPEHLILLAYFHWRAAFLMIPLEIPLLILLRKSIQSLFTRFLFVNCICGLLWTSIWHPDWGKLDWDLFSQFGIPMHVLLGYLVTEQWQTSKDNES